MAEEKGAAVVRKYEEGKSLRTNHDTRWDMLAPLIAPSRYGIRTQIREGQSILKEVYDSTGNFAADIAAKFIGGELHNPANKWINLKEERDWLNEEDDVREWLEESRDRQLNDLSQSNFYAESYEADIDWLGFGTHSLLTEEKPMLPYKPQTGYRGTRFTVDKIGRFVIYENGHNQVDSEYREFSMNAAAAVDKFGKENLPPNIVQDYIKGNFVNQYKFIHGVYPRRQEERGRYGNKKMPWASCYVEAESKKVVKESGYPVYPFTNARWERVPGEVYGRGRGEIALGDLQTQNAAKRMSFEDWALKMRPVTFVANDAVIGTIDLIPGTFKTVRSSGKAVEDSFYQYQTGSHPEISQINQEDLRRSIRQAFFVEQILQMLEVDKTEMTAYEFRRKMELLFKLIGPVYGRWISEFGIPFVERHWQLLYDNGVFSPPPDILLEQGGSIKVEFDNGLARAQRADELGAMDRMLQRLGPMAEAQVKYGGKGYAEVLDNIPWDEWVRKMSEVEGVPATLLNSQRTVATIRKSRAEFEKEQRAQMEAMGIAEGMGKAAPMVKALQERRAA